MSVEVWTPLSQAQLAALTPMDRRDYVQRAPEAMRAAAAADAQEASARAAMTWLSLTYPKYAQCPAVTGGGQTMTIGEGKNAQFQLPAALGGLLETVIVQVDVAYTYTPAGSGPFITVNAAAPYSLIEEYALSYGGAPVDRGHPFMYAVQDGYHRGYGRTTGAFVGSGLTSWTDIQNAIRSSLTVNSGANTTRMTLRFDRNPLNDGVAAGLLPISAINSGRIDIRTPTLKGADPLLNVFNTNGTITNVSFTIKVIAQYRDGSTLTSPQPLQGPAMSEFPGYQTITEPDLLIKVAGASNWNSQRLATGGPIYTMVSLVMDGISSTSFCGYANLTGMALQADESNTRPLIQFGNPTDIGMEFFHEEQRRMYGQDVPIPGLVPWVNAVGDWTNDPSDRSGRAMLNTGPGGWQSIFQRYTLGAIGANYTPRVVTFLGLLTKGLEVV